MSYWIYRDAIGIERKGKLMDIVEGQGTDVTYWFRRDDGKLDLVSGKNLKEARRENGYTI